MLEPNAGRIRRIVANAVKISLLGLPLIFILGCAMVGPNYTSPLVPLPNHWRNLFSKKTSQQAELLKTWWQVFQDPVLNELVQKAASNNHDIKEALSRVREARFYRLKSRSAFYPNVNATASADKSRSGDSDDLRDSGSTELYSAGFDAGWELDLFGGVRRDAEAYQADLEAEKEDLNDVMVTLLAEVATNYIDLRTYQARLAVAQSNVAAQKETWQLLDSLARSGSGDELAVAQARYNLESSRAGIPDLEVGLEEAMNRLAVLTGQPAGSLHQKLSAKQPVPQVSSEIAVGVPADVIRQRPDIRRAERELAAQTARIGVATADLYPKLTLSGTIGLEALKLSDLFSLSNRMWSYGPGFSWQLFDAGAIRNNIKVQEELAQQALIRYESAVLTALEEVENALIAYAKQQQKLSRLEAAVDAARKAAQMAEYQYTTGMIGFSDVLDAQRSQLSFEDQLVESKGAALSGLVTLYKALGGGWQSFDYEIPSEKLENRGHAEHNSL